MWPLTSICVLMSKAEASGEPGMSEFKTTRWSSKVSLLGPTSPLCRAERHIDVVACRSVKILDLVNWEAWFEPFLGLPNPSGGLGRLSFLFQPNMEKQHLVLLLQICGTNSQEAAGLLRLSAPSRLQTFLFAAAFNQLSQIQGWWLLKSFSSGN